MVRGLSDKIRWTWLFLALVLPILFWWQWILPRQDALIDAQQEIEQLRTKALRVGGTEQRSLPQTQLANVIQRLGNPEQLPARVERLHDLLLDNHVVLLKATYKFMPDGAGEIGRYEVQLEVEGPYYGVRLFSRSMLAQDEAIALESIDLRRPPGGTGKIGAVMRWVMFVQLAAQ